jgi:hypothetical protein
MGQNPGQSRPALFLAKLAQLVVAVAAVVPAVVATAAVEH